MLLVTEDFTQTVAGDVTASSEAATMPASRLENLQISRRWRGTTISNTPWIQWEHSGNYGEAALGYNVVAVIGYDGEATRNMLHDSLRFGLNVAWTNTNLSWAQSTQQPPAGVAFQVHDVTAAATAAGFTVQTVQTPGEGSVTVGAAVLKLRVGVFVKQRAGEDIDLRIHAYSTAGVHEAWSDFNIGSGTVGSSGDTGSYTRDTAGIESLGDGWYFCFHDFTTDAASTITVRFQLLTGAGSTTIPSGEGLYLGVPAMLLQTSNSTAAEHPISESAGSGPMFYVKLGNYSISGAEIVAGRSGWIHGATRNQLRGFGSRFSFYYQYSTSQSAPTVRVELYDPYNVNTWLEAGRLIVGKAVDLSGNFIPSDRLGVIEPTVEVRADGGQIYRAQNSISRVYAVEFFALTEAQAMDSINLLARTQGMSKQVLVIGEEGNAKYKQESMVYGYIEELDEIAYSVFDRWTWRMTIRETL